MEMIFWVSEHQNLPQIWLGFELSSELNVYQTKINGIELNRVLKLNAYPPTVVKIIPTNQPNQTKISFN